MTLDSLKKTFSEKSDGSLPEITLNFINDQDKRKVLIDIVSNSDLDLQGKTLWDKSTQCDVDCSKLSNEQVLQILDDQHHLIIKSFKDLPEIGLGVWDKSISLDIKTGSEWTSVSVDTLLKYLSMTKASIPSVEIKLDEQGEFFGEADIAVFEDLFKNHKD